MRTQEEILERAKNANDIFGTQLGDLVPYMEFENAKQFLKEDYVDKIESGEDVWNMLSNPKEEILDYLEFAYEKAEDERGLSASRSMLHFKTWIWLDDEVFYNKVIGLIDNYTNYGIPALDEISKHYGFVREKQDNP